MGGSFFPIFEDSCKCFTAGEQINAREYKWTPTPQTQSRGLVLIHEPGLSRFSEPSRQLAASCACDTPAGVPPVSHRKRVAIKGSIIRITKQQLPGFKNEASVKILKASFIFFRSDFAYWKNKGKKWECFC